MIRAIFSACVLTFVLSIPSQAAVFSIGSAFGANSVTRDTLANQDWLDLDFSFGTVADINAQLLPGERLEGWRRATTAEIVTFWQNAGIVVTDMSEPASGTADLAQVMATSGLMDLIGQSNDGGGSFDFSTGYTAEAGAGLGQWLVAYLSRQFGANSFTASAAVTNVERSANLGPGDTLPSWLVRDIARIPLPATLALVLPILALGFIALKRRAR